VRCRRIPGKDYARSLEVRRKVTRAPWLPKSGSYRLPGSFWQAALGYFSRAPKDGRRISESVLPSASAPGCSQGLRTHLLGDLLFAGAESPEDPLLLPAATFSRLLRRPAPGAGSWLLPCRCARFRRSAPTDSATCGSRRCHRRRNIWIEMLLLRQQHREWDERWSGRASSLWSHDSPQSTKSLHLSPKAKNKDFSKRTERRVARHSFRTLLKDLATLTRNEIHVGEQPCTCRPLQRPSNSTQ